MNYTCTCTASQEATHICINESLAEAALCPKCCETVEYSVLPIGLLGGKEELLGSGVLRGKMMDVGRQALEDNLTSLDSLQASVDSYINTLIRDLQTAKVHLFAEIHSLRSALEETVTKSLAEAAALLNTPFPENLPPLQAEMRRFSPDSARFSLLNAHFNPSNLSISSFKPDFSPSTTLPFVSPTYIGLHNLPQNTYSMHIFDSPLPISTHCFLVFLSPTEVLVSLSSPYREILLINPADGSFHIAGEMTMSRNDPGAMWVPELGELYIFGGWNETDNPLFHCQTIIPHTRFQRKLPDLVRSRAIFNPCLHCFHIFLCGGGPSIIDIFDLKSQNYVNMVDLALSGTGMWSCTSLIDQETLVIVSNTHLFRWNLSTNEVIQTMHEPYLPRSMCLPVFFENLVYILMLTDEDAPIFVCLDAGTGAINKKIEINR